MLFIGVRFGNKAGPKVDIAVDPLEGTTLCAKNMPGAIAPAMAEKGTLLHAPGRLHEKIAIGRAIPRAWSISSARRAKHPQASRAGPKNTSLLRIIENPSRPLHAFGEQT
jgi:fructose-1,6-bisphosphatase/sedoheptulose 1,7-bisphosphatase-like protein